MENGKFLLFLSARTYKVDTQRQGMRKKVNHWQRSNVFSQKPFVSLLLFLCSRVFFFLFWPFLLLFLGWSSLHNLSLPFFLLFFFLHLSLFFSVSSLIFCQFPRPFFHPDFYLYLDSFFHEPNASILFHAICFLFSASSPLGMSEKRYIFQSLINLLFQCTRRGY